MTDISQEGEGMRMELEVIGFAMILSGLTALLLVMIFLGVMG